MTNSGDAIGSMSLADPISSSVTPFPAPKLMDLPMFQGEQKEDLYWGTYRPQEYFGLSARNPKPLSAGLMWLVMRDGKPTMRHFCEDKDGLRSFGWKDHNGRDFGRQVLIENEMTLETSFVKSKDGSHGYGGDWSVRINVENIIGPLDEEKLGANLFFYIVDESQSALHLGFKDSSTLAYGHREDVGNWQLHLRSENHDDLETHYCGIREPNSVDLANLVLINLDQSKSGLKLSDKAESSSNVYVFQIITKAPNSTIDIAFISGLKDKTAKMEKRIDDLTGSKLSTLLGEKHSAFDEKFKKCYNLSEKVDSDSVIVGKAAISNMLGGIGYFYGQSKIADPNAEKGYLEYWEAGLYTTVPCRPKFPWGFLWDEGFHQMLIWRWDVCITLEIVGHWLDLMNIHGWIPREQILGDEALSKIRPEYVIQKPDIANPPTLLFVLCDLINGINAKKFTDEETKFIKIFLEQGFVRLEAWFGWLYTSQKGKTEGSFYWRGRDTETNEELNPRTLSSGMDDYPRASNPSSDEMHVDLRCWIYLAADSMKFIAESLYKKEAVDAYSLIVNQLSDFDALNEMHYDHDLETYLDFGNHTEKVRMVFEHGKLVRVEDEKPEPKLVPHIGYNSFFPFISQIIPSDSQILEEQLKLISNESIVWSDYGLLSLSKTSSLYMKWNALHQKPYWRGPIWMNMNYLILSSLYKYSKVTDGPYSRKAGVIYDKLRNNMISNVVGNYDKTGYIWEQYDQTEGSGEGGRDFTGWSSLILLIMSEDYPRL